MSTNKLLITVTTVTVAMVIVLATTTSYAVHQNKNVLNKITRFECDFPHTQDAPRMQLGTVVLYFENDPIVNRMPSKNEHDALVFFFPRLGVSTGLYSSLVNALKPTKNDVVTVHCHRVSKPIEGVELVISYDPELVIVDKKGVRSPHLEPGVAFSFYNKRLLDELKNQPKAVLHISYRCRGVMH